jgi:16S rRNA (cytosine967-C5)-methyltransferase
MGAFQALFCDQVTFPSMVHTSVDLARKRGHAGTARLVNAVLRRVPERIEDVRLPPRETGLPDHLSARYSMPRWLVEEWLEQFGEERCETLCAASNEPAPIALRVNTALAAVDEIAARLEKSAIRTRKATAIPEELTVIEGNPLRTKLFRDGFFMVQDPASMLAGHLVQPAPGERVLDLCAAPGGKATHLWQLADGKAVVTAADRNTGRLEQVRDNAARLRQMGLRLVCADGTCAPFPRSQFDAILVDAPCTGLGTLRRHPDLKWRVRPGDASRLAVLQRDLLREAARLCQNCGRIVYCVCTLAKEETIGVAEFARKLDGFESEDGPPWLNPWKIASGLYQTLPGVHNLDGFFLIRLRKRS